VNRAPGDILRERAQKQEEGGEGAEGGKTAAAADATGREAKGIHGGSKVFQ
jgi:hypothetical protein